MIRKVYERPPLDLMCFFQYYFKYSSLEGEYLMGLRENRKFKKKKILIPQHITH